MDSNKKTEETSDDIVFYYDRSRRLKNAPPEVKALYEPDFGKSKGIFRVLVDTKRNRYLFGSIVILCIVILAHSFSERVPSGKQLGGSQLSCESFVYEGSCYVSVMISSLKDKPCIPDALSVDISLFDAHKALLYSQPFTASVLDSGGALKQKVDLRDGAVYLEIKVEYNGDIAVVKKNLQ